MASIPQVLSPILPGSIDPGAAEIGAVLLAQGHQALLAGGCVRDLILGREPKDWDLVTDATSEQVSGLFPRTIDAGGERFGILRVLHEDRAYEVARIRREGDYTDGRHPDTIQFTHDPRQDASRRDFTVNGLLLDLGSQELIDVVGGQRDLLDGVIRAIGDPTRRFGEDHLRLLRAVRFAARFQFRIEPETWQAILDGAEHIRSISAERIRDELNLILTEHGAAPGFQMLLDSGLLHSILPEVAALDGVQQPPEHHPEGDVWTHVGLMLAEVDRLSEPDLAVAWGVLLHDIGKPGTLTISDRIRFHGHHVLGAQMADQVARRLRMSNDMRRRIVELIRHHMRFRNTPQMRTGKLNRFLRQPYFHQLLELHRLDCIGCHGKLDLYDFCRQRVDEMASQTQEMVPRLIDGDDLIALGYEPGPHFARILAWVEDEHADGRIVDKASAEEAVSRQFPRS